MTKSLQALFILALILLINITNAQSVDSTYQENIIQDTSNVELSNIVIDSSRVVRLAKPQPSENLNDIFSQKLNKWVDNEYIKSIFEITENPFSSSEYPKNILDDTYVNRLKEAEEVIDLTYNDVVKNFIVLYTEKRRSQAEVLLGMSAYYFPIFERELDKQNMPLELKYLPIIESALNPVARSRMGASGLWQFMYQTGKNLGLDVNNYVDERRDPIKSSVTAVKYLKQLYEIYDDWHLAIAAYNCGPGNVNKAIRRSGGKRNYWDIYYWLPRETRGYVPGFIAVAYMMNYYKEHELNPVYPQLPLHVDTIHVSSYLHFEQVASQLQMDIEKIRMLNPMYRKDIIPAKINKPYPLVLPVPKMYEFIDKESSILAYNRDSYFPNNTLKSPKRSSRGSYATPADVANKAKIKYTIKAGDNIGFIASWFNVRASDVRAWNNIRRNLIREGQKLTIYVPKNKKSKYKKVNSMSFDEKQRMVGASTNSSKSDKIIEPMDTNYVYYTVRSGDNMWDIAKKFPGVSSKDIKRLNKISNVRGLYIGQKLKIKRK